MSTPASTSVTPAELAALLASFNEVTARLQTSHEALRGEVVRLSRELGEANAQVERSGRLAALGEMAAGIAHEVRNPLGSIRLYARMLEQDLAEKPEQAKIAVKINAAVRAVEGIVGDVLSFAREMRLRPQPVEVGALFDRVLESCCHEGVAGWQGVKVERRDRLRGACQVVHADCGLITQALVNLVRNGFEAIGAAKGEGREHCLTLDCRTRKAAEAGGQRRSYACLRVKDTGPGVTPEIVSRMFNPFFTTRDTGTGLGLAIVHRIVDAHGGRVTIRNNAESGEGPGACVEILLPSVGGCADRAVQEPERGILSERAS
ncbi:MAG: ATP-binding protein [Phycisphaerales bacterium]|jgi:signal transduction histidine kinase